VKNSPTEKTRASIPRGEKGETVLHRRRGGLNCSRGKFCPPRELSCQKRGEGSLGKAKPEDNRYYYYTRKPFLRERLLGKCSRLEEEKNKGKKREPVAWGSDTLPEKQEKTMSFLTASGVGEGFLEKGRNQVP